MSTLLKKGWCFIPQIISREEAIQIKYQNLCGAVSDLGSLDGHTTDFGR